MEQRRKISMYLFFDFDVPVIKALSKAIVCQTKEDILNHLKEEKPGIKDIDIASLGYSNKLICREEFREVWCIFEDSTLDNALVGKVIEVKDIKRFSKSILKWISTKEESFPEDSTTLKELINSIQ